MGSRPSPGPLPGSPPAGAGALNEQFLDQLRIRLARVDRLPQLALLGTVCGFLTGAVIIAFRLSISGLQTLLLPPGGAENYEGLPALARFLLPLGGAILIGLLLRFLARETQQVGVVHVMERFAYHQGRMPLRNALWQFLGATLSIASGHSVGREGPGVHLGAASGSLLGRLFALPDNSGRTLVACGVAGAIAASFDTPLAGVIFSMEVILLEYSIASFTPVILAAVSATTTTRWVFGSTPVFAVPDVGAGSLHELPLLVLMGLFIGGLAALFVRLLRFLTRHSQPYAIWQRTTLAGLVTGLCALGVPQVLGIGYDTVNTALLGEAGITLLIVIALAKLLTTAVCIGLGLPGGLIGPTLVIGAAAGAAMGHGIEVFFPLGHSPSAFYAMLGMGAMMGATLQAPLAALTALVEFTANPAIILPGMLAIIAAGLAGSELFGSAPVFVMLLRERGLDYRNDPRAQSLRRLSVARIMNTSVVSTARRCTRREAADLLKNEPQWIVILDGDRPRAVLPAADLARHLQEGPAQDGETEPVDLLEIPAHRRDAAIIHLRANLEEALQTLEKERVDVLCVVFRVAGRPPRVYGVLSAGDIERYYSR